MFQQHWQLDPMLKTPFSICLEIQENPSWVDHFLWDEQKHAIHGINGSPWDLGDPHFFDCISASCNWNPNSFFSAPIFSQEKIQQIFTENWQERTVFEWCLEGRGPHDESFGALIHLDLRLAMMEQVNQKENIQNGGLKKKGDESFGAIREKSTKHTPKKSCKAIPYQVLLHWAPLDLTFFESSTRCCQEQSWAHEGIWVPSILLKKLITFESSHQMLFGGRIFRPLYIEKRAPDSYYCGDKYAEISLGQWSILGKILVFQGFLKTADWTLLHHSLHLDPGKTMAFFFGVSTTSHFVKKD